MEQKEDSDPKKERKGKGLIVEFAIENIQVVKSRAERVERGRKEAGRRVDPKVSFPVQPPPLVLLVHR